ncbi:MAG: hypothetical protein BGP03_12245 [Pseudonocardia sp. 73-21]|nr:MAG: hypothetical protein BGP03_12245 [Pseudonocardia sp. 73-21]
MLNVWESGRTAQAVVTVNGLGSCPGAERRETAMQPGTLTRPELTLADRCDRCGAAAKVRAVLPKGGELLFCGHHAKAHADKLAEMQAQLQ